MSDVVARPMPVPDLAGLLARPKRTPKATVVEPLSDTTLSSDNPVTPEIIVDDLPAMLGRDSVATKPDLADETPLPAIKAASQQSTASAAKSRRSSNPVREVSLRDSGRQYLRTKALQLPRSVHRRVTEEAARRGTTATALMLMAVNSTYQQLPEALRRKTQQSGAVLFDIPQDRAGQEPTVQTTLRMTDAQLEAINELVAANSTNRSRLFGTAIELFLDLRKTSDE